MTEFASPPLSAWQSFYVIVGSAGAALVAIQFVVITLIAAMGLRPTPDSISAFGTPTLVHLAGALLVQPINGPPYFLSPDRELPDDVQEVDSADRK